MSDALLNGARITIMIKNVFLGSRAPFEPIPGLLEEPVFSLILMGRSILIGVN